MRIIIIHVLFFLSIIFEVPPLAAQPTFRLSGWLKELNTKKPVEGASVFIPNVGSFVTDSAGSFKVSHFPAGLAVIKIRHIGYKEKIIEVAIETDTVLEISLEPLTINLKEVTVTATRKEILVTNSPSVAEVITKDELGSKNGSALSDAVSGSSGVFIKSYGGLGALQTISMRGTSAEHTLFLVDGIRYNSFQNGLVDLGIFLTDNVERIEIVRGGNSALYGADALGGVVNIITQKHPDRFHADVRGSLGSYGYKKYFLDFENRLENLSWQAGYSNESGSGRYNFFFHDGAVTKKLERTNSDFVLSHSFAQFNYKLYETSALRFLAQYSVADRGLGGLVVAENSTSLARLTDKDFFSALAFDGKLSSTFSLAGTVAVHSSFEKYVDPDLSVGDKITESHSKNLAADLTAQMHYIPTNYFLLSVGSEIARAAIQSPSLRDNVVRIQKSIFLSNEILLQPDHFPFNQMSFYPSVRFDAFSDVGSAVSPKIGVNLKIVDDGMVHLRSSFGKNFRVPTFNDLYWTQGGNPSLSPERSLSFDAGLILSTSILGKQHLELSYFDIDTKDRIVWTPGASGVWSPKNIARVKSTGIEASFQWIPFDETINLKGNYNLTNAIKKSRESEDDQTYNKRLIYIPQEVANISASVHYRFLTLNLFYEIVGFRYFTETNDPKYILPTYQKMDVNLFVKVLIERMTMTAKLEVDNVFNADYQIIASYPTPLRNFRFSLGFNY